MNPLHPKKLLLTKWTAVTPIGRNKHFLVSKVIQPDPPAVAIEWIEIEAVLLEDRQTDRLAGAEESEPVAAGLALNRHSSAGGGCTLRAHLADTRIGMRRRPKPRSNF